MKNTKKIVALLLAIVISLSTISLTGCQIINDLFSEEEVKDDVVEVVPVLDPTDDNFRTFYQIFVGSFSDASNDGVGDIRGIINRIDYLNDGDINSGNDLGVQGIWLSPIFSSPSYHKYDAQDYYQIDWRFGVESDLVELINLCVNDDKGKSCLCEVVKHLAVVGSRANLTVNELNYAAKKVNIIIACKISIS